MWIRLLQISQQNFRMQARIRKHHGLQIMFQKLLRHTRSFVDVASANSQRAIHHRRIVKYKGLFRRRCPIRAQHFNLSFNQLLRQCPRIRNCRRAADKLWRAPIKFRNPLQAAQHVAQMTSEHAAI